MLASSEQARQAVGWAAATLTQLGCTLHAVGPARSYQWDVETPFGWRAVNSWRELCEVAAEVQARSVR